MFMFLFYLSIGFSYFKLFFLYTWINLGRNTINVIIMKNEKKKKMDIVMVEMEKKSLNKIIKRKKKKKKKSKDKLQNKHVCSRNNYYTIHNFCIFVKY